MMALAGPTQCPFVLSPGIPFSKPKLITQLEQGTETRREERKRSQAAGQGNGTLRYPELTGHKNLLLGR